MDLERRVLPLVRQATRLEEEAEQALFYRREFPGLARYAARLVDPDDVEDVVQDALVKFLAQRARERERHRERHRERERGGERRATGEQPWAGLSEEDARIRLMVMVRDVVIDRERVRRKESRMMRLVTGPSAAIRRWMSPRRATDDDAILRAVRDALLQLPASLRDPWILVKEHGFTVAEAAVQLGCRRKSINAAIAKANRHLRDRLMREGITPATLRGRDD